MFHNFVTNTKTGASHPVGMSLILEVCEQEEDASKQTHALLIVIICHLQKQIQRLSYLLD